MNVLVARKLTEYGRRFWGNNMNKVELKKHAGRYIQIVLGCLMVCLGFNLFIIPAHLLTGGLSGIALIVYYLTGLPVGMQNQTFA